MVELVIVARVGGVMGRGGGRTFCFVRVLKGAYIIKCL